LKITIVYDIILAKRKERGYFMLPKSFTTNKPRTIVVSSITLILGVLFCCSMSFGNGLSWLIGGTLCFAGILYIINSIVYAKSLLTIYGLLGVGAISFGVMFIIKQLAQILVDYVPYLMIAIGIVVLIDAFLAKFVRYSSTVVFVIMLVAGALITTLGFCLMFISALSKIAAIVFGCILIVASLYTLISLALKKNRQ
jgi:hypothetical protein